MGREGIVLNPSHLKIGPLQSQNGALGTVRVSRKAAWCLGLLAIVFWTSTFNRPDCAPKMQLLTAFCQKSVAETVRSAIVRIH